MRGTAAVFDTALGRCRVAWNTDGLTAVRLPDAAGDEPVTPDHAAALADAPPFVRDAVSRMQALLAGEPVRLHDLPLDMSGIEPFARAVYAAAQRLEPGETCTYGELAARIGQAGDPGAARAVGQALGRNPWPLVVPCHRVLAAGGKLGGFSAPGGAATKRRLLVIEAAMRPRAGELF